MKPLNVPPQSLESERAVLGSCLLSKDALISAAELLKPDDFYDTNNKVAFDVFMGMYASDKPVDYITVTNELQAKGLLDRLGGQQYLLALAEEVTSTANVEYYAEIVRDRSIRRKLISAGENVIKMAVNYDTTIQSILEEAEKIIFDAGQNRNANEFRHVREILNPVMAALEKKHQDNLEGVDSSSYTTGYPTGFIDLDRYTGGLQPGSFNIIAARPSMGKTALALNIAQFGGRDNHPVLIFSLEMPAEQLTLRMIAAECCVDLSSLIKDTLNTKDLQSVKAAYDTLAGKNIYINDATSLSAIDFRARCRKFRTRHPDLALIVVDYLQLMTSGGKDVQSRQLEVAEISRQLKAVAREMNCPVIALSQLSRAAEQRNDKKPQLADLRDSGAIEQDADVVMMLFRQDYYSENENNELTDSEADIRIAKNRNGSTGVFKLIFRREITRFLNHGS